MSVDNRYAFLCGVAVYVWQNLLNIPADLFVGIIKAALFGAAGMAGKELFTYIKKAVVTYNITSKLKNIMATLSMKNAKHPAPRWFRKLKAFCLSMALVANAMIAGYPAKDELTKTRVQLWCTVGIAGILEGFEKLLKDDGEDDQPEPKTER